MDLELLNSSLCLLSIRPELWSRKPFLVTEMSFWRKFFGRKDPKRPETPSVPHKNQQPNSQTERPQQEPPNLSITLSVSGSAPATQRGNRGRTDPAALAWSANPEAYKSPFRTSWKPVCPYCSSEIKNRKRPTRRSKFKCSNCGLHIWVDPWQRIFRSVYLRDMQGLVAKYLDLLDVGEMRMGAPATAGTTADFWWASEQRAWTNKKDLSDAEAADVLWTLMNYNVTNMDKIITVEEKPNFVHYAKELQRCMAEFKAEEKILRQQKGKPPSKQKKETVDPSIRLEAALHDLPLPASFRSAAIALRAIIRKKKKDGSDFESDLRQLYLLLAREDFLLRMHYFEDLGPGYNVAASIPRKEWESLDMPYEQIGFNELSATKTDVKWFVEAWGNPQNHRSAQDFHKKEWERAVRKYRKRRQQEDEKRRRELRRILRGG